jgi:FKBP-type peptidyl-prolyl cis-trans isomerase
MMKKMISLFPLLALTAGLVLMASCTEDTEDQDRKDQEQRFFDIYMAANYPDATPRTSGLYFVENKAGSGDMPDDSAWVRVNHVAYKVPSNQVYDTYIERVAIDNNIHDTSALYGPYKMQNGTINEGFTEGLSMMREGGEATFLFTSELGFGSSNTGDVSAYQSLKYEVVLVEVLGDIDVYEQGKIDTYLDTIAQVDTVYDAEADAIINYIVDVETDGAPVGVDSTLEIVYTGYFMDGRVFDERTADDPWVFKISEVEWAARWDLVLPRLNEGEKVRMVFPYQSAYGVLGQSTQKGNVLIPPYETLLFDVEIISVESLLDEDDPDEEE